MNNSVGYTPLELEVMKVIENYGPLKTFLVKRYIMSRFGEVTDTRWNNILRKLRTFGNIKLQGDGNIMCLPHHKEIVDNKISMAFECLLQFPDVVDHVPAGYPSNIYIIRSDNNGYDITVILEGEEVIVSQMLNMRDDQPRVIAVLENKNQVNKLKAANIEFYCIREGNGFKYFTQLSKPN